MQICFATISNHTSVSKLLLPAKHALTFLCSRKHPFQRSHEDLLKSHYPPHSAGRLLSQHQTSHLPQWLRRLPATHHLSHWCQNHPEQSLCLSIEFHASIPPSRNQHIPPLGKWKNHRIKVLTGSGYLSSQQANGKSWRPLANFETNIQQFEKQKYLTLPSKLDFNKYSPICILKKFMRNVGTNGVFQGSTWYRNNTLHRCWKISPEKNCCHLIAFSQKALKSVRNLKYKYNIT